MSKTRLRPFVVAMALPESEREVIEAARRRLGLRSWSEVALVGWERIKKELGLDNKEGGGNGESA